jgi:RNA polymerase sigma factor (sigma-70 family)
MPPWKEMWACRAVLKKTVPVAVVRGVARGQDDLLGEIELIYRLRYPAFLRVAVAITRDEQLGADAVQDAFVGIVRSRGGIRKRAALEAFAWRAVVNAARDRRVVRAEAGEPTELVALSASEPDESVRQAIAELPERQRIALFLRYFADLEYAEIGRVMQVRPGTVAAALNAGRAAVKESLEREEAAAWRS